MREPLRSLSKELSAADLKHHWYYMRVLPAGYLYVLKPDKTWQSYLVDRSGLLREMPPLDLPSPADAVEPMDQPDACRRPEHNPVALEFIVLDPEKTPKVWMAFSRFRWPQGVLDDYRDDKDGCRSKRMTQVDLMAAARGQLGVGTAVPNGRAMTAWLSRHVADYTPQPTREFIDQHTLEPLRARSGAAVSPQHHALFPSASSLAEQMAQVSKNTPAKTGLFLVLDDVVGHAMQLNYLRNKTVAEAAALEGVGDKERSRKRLVAALIEGIRLNAERNPGPWYARHYGADRYLKHIDQKAWQEALREHVDLAAMEQRKKDISEDFCLVIRSLRWQQQQRTDFCDQPGSAASHEAMVAYCLCGSGQTLMEQEQLWTPVLNLPPEDPDNWLARAMGAMYVPYLKYLAQTPGDQDDAYNATKEAEGLVRTFLGKGVTQIQGIRVAIRARRAANANTATLIETSAGQLFRLRDKNPKAYRKLIRQVTLALITRDDIVPEPTLMRGTWQQITQKWGAAFLGDPRVQARAPVAATKGSTVGLSEIRKPALSGAVQGAVVLTPPGTREEATAVVAWVVKKMEGGGKLDYVQLERLKLTELHITAQAAARPTQANPILQNQLMRLGLRADVVLSAGALFFQVMQGVDMIKQFRKTNDPGTREYADLGIGLTYSVLGALGAYSGVTAAVKAFLGAEKVGVSVLIRRAAVLGAVAGVIDGAYAIFKGGRKYAAGDKDAGSWSMGAGALFVVAGVASYGLGATTAASVAGVEATGIAAMMGPVAWTLLLIAAASLGLYFAWQAFATDDENLLPVEYWLDNGVFGKGAYRRGKLVSKNPYLKNPKDTAVEPFASLEAEIEGLNKVVLVAQASFGELRGSYGGLGSYQIDLPRYAEGSRLEVQFHAYQKGQRLPIGELQCEDGREQPSRYELSRRLTGMQQKPKLLVDKALGTVRIEGFFSTMDSSGAAIHRAAEKVVEAISGTEVPDACVFRGS
ncbi:hypothetical protein D7S91_41005 [Burkholderia contaminans]|nr:hypothetical protein [Burkholderia contaminans]MBA9868036.1 hypothetical protein [Burkholderia contaminans]MBA9934952.1 hypothetical protein [Burkholderia contaminans]MCB4332272.1 hypothetical protein [Burkholderia contaminans]